MKVIDGLFGARLCLLAVCVFVCSIDRSYSTDTNKQTPGRPVDPSKMSELQRNSSVTIEFNFTHIAKETPGSVDPSSLSTLQRNSAVTIEFDFKHIAKENRAAALDVAKREARKKILAYLNRIKDETTTQAPTTVAATTQTEPPTTTTTQFVPYERKRRRRGVGDVSKVSNDTFTEDNVLFVINDPEIDDDGIFRFSIFIDNEASTLGDLSHLHLAGLNLADLDLGDLLLKAAHAVNETGDLKAAANAPVVKISRGLPPVTPDASIIIKDAMFYIQVCLPILLAIIILLFVFIIVCCWKAKHKKVRDVEHPKIIPKQDSKPTQSNGHAHPRILDDNDGWLIPLEQFSSEQK